MITDKKHGVQSDNDSSTGGYLTQVLGDWCLEFNSTVIEQFNPSASVREISNSDYGIKMSPDSHKETFYYWSRVTADGIMRAEESYSSFLVFLK